MRANRIALTDSLANSEAAREALPTYIWDTALPGFGFRILASGKRQWCLRYRDEERRRKHIILGSFPTIGVDEARSCALERLSTLGQSVLHHHSARPFKYRPPAGLLEPSSFEPGTVGAIVHAYLAACASPTKRWRQWTMLFATELFPGHAHRQLTDLTRRDFVLVLDQIIDRGARSLASNFQVQLARFLEWSIDQQLVDKSVLYGMRSVGKRPLPSKPRSISDLVELYLGCEEIGWPHGRKIQLMILTGQTPGVVNQLKWDELDLDQKMWCDANRHLVPLSAAVLALIQLLPKLGPHVFGYVGDELSSGFYKAKLRLVDQSGVSGWSPRDIRKAVAEGMTNSGIPFHVVDKVLGRQGVIGRLGIKYNRHDYMDQRVDALERWGQTIVEQVSARRAEAQVGS